MPRVEVDEPHAKPPRVPTVRTGRSLDGTPEPDRGLVELDGVEVDGGPLELSDCQELSIVDSTLRHVGFVADGGPELEIRSSALDGCDLSRTRVAVIQRTRLDGCKLTGTDLSGAALTDVIIQGCSLRFTNLRMARLTRVGFVDCVLDEVDAFQLEATDVSFDGCRVIDLNLDRLRATRVDLRGAVELGLSGVGRLDGCLVADHQLPALALPLAMAVGLDLEVDPEG